jgi:hypothetical protein
MWFIRRKSKAFSAIGEIWTACFADCQNCVSFRTEKKYTSLRHKLIQKALNILLMLSQYNFNILQVSCTFKLNFSSSYFWSTVHIDWNYVTLRHKWNELRWYSWGQKYHGHYGNLILKVYAIALWLFHLMCILCCGCFNLFCNKFVCICVDFVMCGCVYVWKIGRAWCRERVSCSV